MIMMSNMAKRKRSIDEELRHAIRSAEKRGITRYRIAQISGVSAGQLSRLMSGEVTPRLATAEKIADAIGYTITIAKAQS